MLDGRIDQPLPAALLLAALAVALPTALGVFRAAPPAGGRISLTVSAAGVAYLAAIWLVLVPLNVVHQTLGERLEFIFGSAARHVSLVDQVAGTHLGAGLAVTVFYVLLTSRPAWLRFLTLTAAVLLGFTALEEVGLDERTPLLLPTNLLKPALVAPAYAAAGWLLIALAAVVAARPASVATPGWLRASPATTALVLTAGVLLQHPVFEELAEFALGAALLQGALALAVSRGRTSCEPSGSADAPTPGATAR